MFILQLDPLLWTSFEALCQLDAQADPSDYFGPPLPLQASLQGTVCHISRDPIHRLSFL